MLAACIGLAVVVGRSFAETHEESLTWKLAGHGFLGFFMFIFNGIPLPLGYVIVLILASRARVNQRAGGLPPPPRSCSG